MTQEQIGIFRFGHLETQTDKAFVCIVTPEKKLSSEAADFVPASVKHSIQPEQIPNFSFSLSIQDFVTNDEHDST